LYGPTRSNWLIFSAVTITGGITFDSPERSGRFCFADVSFTAKHQIIIVDLSGGGDYNTFYGSGNGLIMGTYQGNRYTTFNDWKTATGLEGNSLFANPNFVKTLLKK
jgi:hypothetical protein